VIVQNCALHDLGRAGPQSMGIYGRSLKRITIRDNTFSAIGQSQDGTAFRNIATDIAISDDVSAYLLIYRNTFRKERETASTFLAAGTGLGAVGGVVLDNSFTTLADAGGPTKGILAVNLKGLEHWRFDGNRYTAPNQVVGGEARPFIDRPSGRRLSVAEWQAAGYDKRRAIEGAKPDS
jgi:hypothetical protein